MSKLKLRETTTGGKFGTMCCPYFDHKTGKCTIKPWLCYKLPQYRCNKIFKARKKKEGKK